MGLLPRADDLFGQALSPEKQRAVMRKHAQRMWMHDVRQVAGALAVKHPEMSELDCVKRAVTLANELANVVLPETLPVDEEEFI
jgi:hypothetical protein